jgi:Ca2+-transporting ATPase
MNLPLPLRPIQILWINLVTDGLPALALGIEPAALGIMSKKPRHPKERILSKDMISSIAVIGIVGTIVTLGIFILELGQSNLIKAQTMAFTTLMVFEMFVVFTCRSQSHPLHKIGFFSNPWLIISVIISLLLQIVVLQVPFLQQMFSVVPLTLNDWFTIVIFSSIVFVAEELRKFGLWKLGKVK